VRLSPKSIFFGLVVLGLPIAVVIGWTLATPLSPPLEVGAPGGIGGIGAAAGNGSVGVAPERAKPRPPTTVKFTPAPVRATTRPPAATAPSAAPTATTAPPAATLPTAATLPVLDQPPVPTPTEITVTPTGSASASSTIELTLPEPNSP